MNPKLFKYTDKCNKSTLVLLPLLDIAQKFTEIDSNFINCFYRCDLDKMDNKYISQRLYLVFKDKIKLNELDKLTNNENYIKSFVENGLVILCYKIPQESREIYNQFISGKYSEIIWQHKQKVREFYKEQVSLRDYLKDMFYPSEKFKSILKQVLNVQNVEFTEVIDKPDPLKETFSFYKFVNLKTTYKDLVGVDFEENMIVAEED